MVNKDTKGTTDSKRVTREALAEALGDLFPHYQREKWPFTASQAADAIIAALSDGGYTICDEAAIEAENEATIRAEAER